MELDYLLHLVEEYPILGYNKMHRGTDFKAPSGTPIIRIGTVWGWWCGGGGNCVKINTILPIKQFVT